MADFEAMCLAKLKEMRAVQGLEVETSRANVESGNPSFYIDLTTKNLCGRATAYHLDDMFDIQVVKNRDGDLVLNEHSTQVSDSTKNAHAFFDMFTR